MNTRLSPGLRLLKIFLALPALAGTGVVMLGLAARAIQHGGALGPLGLIAFLLFCVQSGKMLQRLFFSSEKETAANR